VWEWTAQARGVDKFSSLAGGGERQEASRSVRLTNRAAELGYKGPSTLLARIFPIMMSRIGDPQIYSSARWADQAEDPVPLLYNSPQVTGTAF